MLRFHQNKYELRNMNLDDQIAFMDITTNEKFTKYYPFNAFKREECQKAFDTILSSYQFSDFNVKAIVQTSENRMIGFIGHSPFHFKGDKGKLLKLALLPKYWGTKVGLEACQAFIFQTLNPKETNQLYALVHPQDRATRYYAIALGAELKQQVQFNNVGYHLFSLAHESH